MIDIGTVKPGSTIRIPWSSFDKDDGSSITATNYAAADILIYKDGGTTERASTAGFTATTDFDSKTGKHVAVIDLADNTTAGFYSAGSEYMVALDAVTVDAVTTGGWIARFRIGYPNAALDTTIATLASQTSFTLTAGPAEDDALNGFTMMAHDVASAVQAGMAYVLDYTGSTRTVTLVAGPTFTMATTDNVSFFPPIQVFGFGGTAGTFSGGRPEVNTTHAAGTAWGSGAITAASIATDAITAAKIATGAITAAKFAASAIDAAALAADAVTEIQSGLATAASLSTVAGYLDTEIAAILEDTGTTIPAQISALNNLSAAQVNAEVDTALADIHLDHLLAATYDPASKPGAADALLNELVENDGGVARFTANALEEAPAGGGGGDATEAKQDTIIALLGTPTGVSVSADLADIEGKVDDLEGRLTSQRAGYLDNLSAGAVALDSTVAKDATVAKAATTATAASIAALNDISPAEVKTQARTALQEFGAIENP